MIRQQALSLGCMCGLKQVSVAGGSVQSAQSRGKRLSDWEVGLHMQWVSELTCVVGLRSRSCSLKMKDTTGRNRATEYEYIARCSYISRSRCHLTDLFIILLGAVYLFDGFCGTDESVAEELFLLFYYYGVLLLLIITYSYLLLLIITYSYL